MNATTQFIRLLGSKYDIAKTIMEELTKSQRQNEINAVGRICSIYADMRIVITIPERLDYIQKTMALWEISAVLFEAVEKDQLMRCDLVRDNIITIDSTVTLGQAACCLSNKKVLRYFLNSNAETCLIFQDDIARPSTPRSSDHLKKTLEAVPESFDMLYFGRSNDNRFTVKKIAPYLVRTYAPTCLHAYMVSRKGAIKILSLEPLNKNGLDVHIKHAIQKNVIESYAITPSLFFQNRKDLTSTLERRTRYWGLEGGNGKLREYSLWSTCSYYGFRFSAFIILVILTGYLIV